MKSNCPSHNLKLASIAFAVAVSLALRTSVFAMSVTPIVLEMTTSAGGNHSQISVTNDGAKQLPIEIIISRAELNEKGEMSTKPAGDDFLVFPPQALLKPGATQNFRIQWVGEPHLSASQTYVFSVNQVPVKMPQGKSGVQVVFNFATLVNIASPGGQSSIHVVSTGVGKDEKGKVRPEVTVKNPGNSYAKLTDATIKLVGGAWSETLTPEKLRQVMGIGLVQPGKTRKFLLPVDMPDGVTSITANIDYKPAK